VTISSEIAELADTEKVVRQVEDILRKQPEATEMTAVIGDDLPKFYITMFLQPPSKEFGRVMFRVDLEKGGRFADNEEFGYQLQQELDATVTGGAAKVKILQQAEPMDAPVMFRITGGDLRRILEVSRTIQDELRKIPGLMNVRDNAASERFEYTVQVDGDVATSLGILKYDVQRQINLALRGDKASVYRTGGNEYDIIVESDIDSVEELENLAVKSTVAGNKVLLKQIADITLTSKMDYIYRFDKEHSVSVLADVAPGAGAPEITLRFLTDVLPRLDTTGVEVLHDGEMKNIIDNFSNLAIAGLAALLFNYLILLLEFKSFLQPLIILTTVPLSVIGALLGLLVFGQPFSFTAFLGITSLIGVVVNNAILLMEYINHEKEKGHDLKKACIEAVARRYRPIMLSNVTTVMGLVPLATSGSQLFGPMSIAQMSGMMVATLLTLVVIPIVYYRAETTFGSYREQKKGGGS
jgi:multidrug efflux pump subunit AcrB